MVMELSNSQHSRNDNPRSVIVTGGADGIGRAIAVRFLHGGYRVHVCDNRPQALATIRADHPEIRGSVCDVSDPDSVRQMIRDANTWQGELNVLVNNVGLGGPRAAIEDIDVDEWETTFKVNVAGTLHCMQAVIPAMKARQSGVIINISTASTRTRLPMRTAYVASKFAVEGLTLNAARELGQYGIRCNAVLPGIMNNARMDAIIADRAEQSGRSEEDVARDFLRFVSLRQRTEPEDVASMVHFLSFFEGARISGELVAVSGNMEWEE